MTLAAKRKVPKTMMPVVAIDLMQNCWKPESTVGRTTTKMAEMTRTTDTARQHLNLKNTRARSNLKKTKCRAAKTTMTVVA